MELTHLGPKNAHKPFLTNSHFFLPILPMSSIFIILTISDHFRLFWMISGNFGHFQWFLTISDNHGPFQIILDDFSQLLTFSHNFLLYNYFWVFVNIITISDLANNFWWFLVIMTIVNNFSQFPIMSNHFWQFPIISFYLQLFRNIFNNFWSFVKNANNNLWPFDYFQ